MAPWADVCYFADSEWWKWHKDRPDFQAFAGEKCSIQSTGMDIFAPEVHLLRNKTHPSNGVGLSLDTESLITGYHSGWQVVNISVLTGAALILLLGYDAREPESGGPSHWFGHHPKREPVAAYEKYRQSFKLGAGALRDAGVRVINCSPGSAIDAFPRMTLAEALGA